MAPSLPAPSVPLFLAAATKERLLANAKGFVAEFSGSELSITDVAKSISERQDAALPFKVATLVSGIDDLDRLDDQSVTYSAQKRPIVLVFGGNIMQEPKVSRSLYENEKLKANLDACADVCTSLELGDIMPYIFGQGTTESAILSHCAALAIQMTVAKTWLDYGLQPDMLIGHSIGQLAALHISGAMAMSDVFRLVSSKIRNGLSSNGDGMSEMSCVFCLPDEIQSLVHSFNSTGNLSVKIACHNTDQNHVVIGTRRSMSQFAVHCKSFKVELSHEQSFHYSISTAADAENRSSLDDADLGTSTIPVEDCSRYGSSADRNSARIVQSANEPVCFGDAVKRISKKHPRAVWLEAGSSSNILSLVKSNLGSQIAENKLIPMHLGGSDATFNAMQASLEVWRSGHAAACWSFSPVSAMDGLSQSTNGQKLGNNSTKLHSDVDSAYGHQSDTPRPQEVAEILPRLKQVLSDIMGIPCSGIREGSQLSELGLKSSLSNTVMAEVQEYFQTNIESELQEHCVTIGDVAKCIHDALAKQPNPRTFNLNSSKKEPKPADASCERPETVLLQETVVFKTVDGLDLEADIFYPPKEADPSRPLPVALMIHGGGHVMLSRHDTRPHQTTRLLQDGFLPVTVDYRLCPEVPIKEGPMTDVVDALSWARNVLPVMKLKRADVQADGNQVVAIGWSTGGTLVMSLGFNSLARGVRPPDASLVFYCPIDYQDPFWMTPNQPIGSEFADSTFELDGLVAAGLSDKPITKYNVNTAKRAVGGWMSATDGRSRLVLYMNWHGRALHVLLHGLDKANLQEPPMPTPEQIASICPLEQIRRGHYSTPTFLVHSRDDDLVPWQQAHRVWQSLQQRGIDSRLRIIDDAPHLFDLYTRYNKRPDVAHAVKEGYDFLRSHVKFSKSSAL